MADHNPVGAIPGLTPGHAFTRAELFAALGIPAPTGGNWFTGYHQHEGAWFIFAGVESAGRTGHDYGNIWEGDDLRWRGKTGSHLGQATIQSMIGPKANVHLFTRTDDRSPFLYHGPVSASRWEETVPITVWWRPAPTHEDFRPPEELPNSPGLPEGAKHVITVNAYERNKEARRKCIEHWGCSCVVCGITFFAVYGKLGDGFIHVHHLKPISEIGESYHVDPINDLRPVCPNCHAMLHRSGLISIEELREGIRKIAGS